MPDASPDGRYFVYGRYLPDGNSDIHVRSLANGEARPLVATPASEGVARRSPDGTWFAYQFNETGAPEIYIRSFPEAGSKQQVSRSGGYRAVWRADSNELFYLSPDGDLMAVPLTTTPALTAGPPTKLFRTPLDPGAILTYAQFDAASDGQRFLMVVPTTDEPQPVNVILNWQSLLRQ